MVGQCSILDTFISMLVIIIIRVPASLRKGFAFRENFFSNFTPFSHFLNSSFGIL